MKFSKLRNTFFKGLTAVTLLAGSSHVMAFTGNESDDLQQAVVISLLLVAVVFLVRKRMEY